MGLLKYRIGDLIEQTLEMNSDLRFGEDDVRGMTITKQIIPTKANMSGTEVSRFLVVNPHEFVYNPRTHGKKSDSVIMILKNPLLSVGIT